MHLEIRSPDGTARRVEVTGPVVVGRGEDCDIQLLEVKASRRHLRLSREPGEPWVVEDLESSNGTVLGETRVLRARLTHGDLLRVGDTVLAVEDPPAAGLVGGRLTLRAVAGLGADAPPAAAPVLPVAAEPASEAGAHEPAPAAAAGGPRVRPLDMRSFGRGLTLAIVGLLVVAGVQATLGAKGARARQDTEARGALQDLLASADVDAQAFERLAGAWLRRYPDSPDRGALERHLEAVRSRGGVRADVRDRLESLMQRLGSTPEARARSELLALSRALPEDGSLQEQVRLAFVELDRRRAAYERIEGERVCTEAEQLVGEGLPGVAWRRLSAFRAARAKLSPELSARLSAGEDAALAAVRTLAAQTLAAAQQETDLSRRRALLQAAWPGLAGTPEQPAIADALRYASQPPRGPSGRPSAGPSTGPDPGEALLAQAAEAERLFGARRWTQARALFEALRAKPQVPALLQQEWALRSADIERLLGLAAALGQAAAAQPPPARKLSVGAVTVTAADDEGVTWKQGAAEARHPWADVPADDLLPLLAPPQPGREQRLALAVLAASLGRPEAVVQTLTPLYAAGAPGADVDALVARLLEGKAQAPEGGYRLYQGALVDRAGYEQRVEQERLTALEAQAVALLGRLEKEPALKKLERMREARAELDRRRQVALLAIFNEKHYPYPYQRGQPPYIIVQAEIDRRVAAVRELWEGDEHVKLSRSGTLGRLADELAAQIRELEGKGRDVKTLRQGLLRVEPYLTGESIRLREFWLDEGERRLMDYNRWVMQVYNPGQTAFASDVERKQVEITNAYRMMLGYTVSVTPGDADYQAIDETNVARILDTGQIVPGSVMHLRACRIDDRLVRSARGHSADMARRGYFDHFSPPDPATGAPRRSPFDRMHEAGYDGGGGSENIASVGGDPQSPHDAWCHSSGHHRNLLSGWADMGSGQAGGRLWTQNFGIGGGKPTVIEQPAPPPARK